MIKMKFLQLSQMFYYYFFMVAHVYINFVWRILAEFLMKYYNSDKK